eukprot:scaffold18202_cov211-Amphora_coffeaeformis.AAC.2
MVATFKTEQLTKCKQSATTNKQQQLTPLELGLEKVNSDDNSVSSQSIVVPTILNKAMGSMKS